MKVAVVLTHPAPYRDAVLKLLKACNGIEVEAICIFSRDFGHPDMGLGEDGGAIAKGCNTLYPGLFDGIRVAWRLTRRFSARGYEFVVWPAYAPWWLTLPVALRAMLGRRYAIALDTVRNSGGWLSRLIKLYLFDNATFLWVPGAASRKYLVANYGIADKKIVGGLYLPEFSVAKPRVANNDEPVFLMVANNTPLRRMDVVVEGFKKYRAGGGRGRFVVCGKDTASLAGDGVEALDGVPSSELPNLYGKADVYVHNGTEQFSVALLMAAMSGIPLLSGAEVGACVDLLDDGSAGLRVARWYDADEWAFAFKNMFARADEWGVMGTAARRRANNFDARETAAAVSSLILSAFD